MPPEIRVIGVEGMPEVVAGDDLAAQIMGAAQAQGTAIQAGDVLVVTQRIVSKAEDRVVPISVTLYSKPSSSSIPSGQSSGRGNVSETEVRKLVLAARDESRLDLVPQRRLP